MTATPRSYLYVASLATAWVISLLAALLRNHFVNRIVAVSAWTIAALSILGLLGNTPRCSIHWRFRGHLRISPLLIQKTAFFCWYAVGRRRGGLSSTSVSAHDRPRLDPSCSAAHPSRPRRLPSPSYCTLSGLTFPRLPFSGAVRSV
jgi:hypothetical protein